MRFGKESGDLSDLVGGAVGGWEVPFSWVGSIPGWKGGGLVGSFIAVVLRPG